MHPDKFWKYFWSILGICMLCYSLGIAGLLYARPGDAARAALVGASYDSTIDPFQKTAPEAEVSSSDYLYRDSLPLQWEDWSWNTLANWRSQEEHFEGSYSLRALFTEPGAQARANSPTSIDLSPFASLSLAVYPQTVHDVYLELYDTAGNPIVEQSLGWYTQGGALVPDTWNIVTIPLVNLTASSSEDMPRRKISGFSIGADQEGVVFVDALRLNKFVVSHPRWEPSADDGAASSTDKESKDN
jgi:hypothetical protein